jgi:hypothetical protein
MMKNNSKYLSNQNLSKENYLDNLKQTAIKVVSKLKLSDFNNDFNIK